MATTKLSIRKDLSPQAVCRRQHFHVSHSESRLLSFQIKSRESWWAREQECGLPLVHSSYAVGGKWVDKARGGKRAGPLKMATAIPKCFVFIIIYSEVEPKLMPLF
jgi:hypothetical protein